MSVVYGPSHELNRLLIETLTADSTMQTLLYPAWSSAKINANDTRIYNAHVAIDDPKLLQILPRIIVECQQDTNDTEQPEFHRVADVLVWFHSVVPKDQYDHAEALDVRIRTIMASTFLSNSRIIGSSLFEVAPRRRIVETAFYDSWRLVSAFKAVHIGVVAT